MDLNSGALAQPLMPCTVTRGVATTEEALSKSGKLLILVAIYYDHLNCLELYWNEKWL